MDVFFNANIDIHNSANNPFFNLTNKVDDYFSDTDKRTHIDPGK